MLGIGVVGSGPAATQYVECYEQLAAAEVTGVVPSVVGETDADTSGAYPRYESLTTLLDQAEVDVIDVCDPDFPRDRLIEGVAGADVAVLVPHPYELDVPGLRELAGELTAAGDGTLRIKQPYRHHPAFQRMRTHIREDDIGSFGVARVSRRMPFTGAEEATTSSSILTNPGAIYFDCLTWLAGEIEQVYARRNEIGEAREEASTAILRFADGSIGQVELALLSHVDEREFVEVRGTTGGIEFDLADDHGLSYATTREAAPARPPYPTSPERSTDPVYRELAAIVTDLRTDGADRDDAGLTPTEAEASLNAVGAALRSVETNAPVPTEEIPA